MPEDWMEKQDEWVEQNPLRRFRKDKKLTFFKAASFLGVTITTIQQWESGSTKPTDDNMAKLASMIGNDDIAQEWAAWLDERPRAAV